jgi:hypothetical protein
MDEKKGRQKERRTVSYPFSSSRKGDRPRYFEAKKIKNVSKNCKTKFFVDKDYILLNVLVAFPLINVSELMI